MSQQQCEDVVFGVRMERGVCVCLWGGGVEGFSCRYRASADEVIN